MSKRISDIETIHIHPGSSIRMMEKSFPEAMSMARHIFGISEYGHSDKVDGWDRSDSNIKVVFKGAEATSSMGGWEYVVTFEAWCEKELEEE